MLFSGSEILARSLCEQLTSSYAQWNAERNSATDRKKERDAKIDAINDVAQALRALQAEQTSGFGLGGLGTLGSLGAVGQGAGAANLFARRIGR